MTENRGDGMSQEDRTVEINVKDLHEEQRYQFNVGFRYGIIFGIVLGVTLGIILFGAK